MPSTITLQKNISRITVSRNRSWLGVGHCNFLTENASNQIKKEIFLKLKM